MSNFFQLHLFAFLLLTVLSAVGLLRTLSLIEKLNAERARADIANRTKTEFLANMSHELRTPLNAILGFSHSMTAKLFGDLGDDKYAEYAKNIHSSGERLLELVNDVLELARFDAGTTKLDEDAVDLEQLFESVIIMVKSRADDGGIGLVNKAAGTHLTMHGDVRCLKQILFHLLSNAVKFSEPGGVVTLCVDVSDENAISLMVTDTGIGMSEAEVEKALSRFEQVDGSLDRLYDGAGIGLPLSIALAGLHGAKLTIKSEKGKGTTVTVRFPPERTILPADEPADRA